MHIEKQKSQRRLNIHIIDPNVMEQRRIKNTRGELYNMCRGPHRPKEVDKYEREKIWQQFFSIEQKEGHTRRRFEHPAEHKTAQ